MYIRALLPLTLVIVLASCHNLPNQLSDPGSSVDFHKGVKTPGVVRERFIYAIYERDHTTGGELLVDSVNAANKPPSPPAPKPCELFVLPPRGSMPKLPAINYRRMSDDQVGNILVEHIDALRSHIKSRDEKILKEYNDYVARCKP